MVLTAFPPRRLPRFLVTGAKGMLGAAVTHVLQTRELAFRGVDIEDADLTRREEAARLVAAERPTHVIHCAAYTTVDRAEEERAACRAANVDAPRFLGEACAEAGARMALVSTDYVFDGRASAPYAPEAPTCPASVYGETKRDGERALAEVLREHQIVRTAWLFGPGKRNFVLAILERLERGEALRVVDDQHGSPTYAPDLAERLVDLILKPGACGVFHLTNAGETTWHGFAQAIAEGTGRDPETIEPVPTSAYPTAAARPAYSVLDCTRTWRMGVGPTRHWREALGEYLHLLGKAARK